MNYSIAIIDDWIALMLADKERASRIAMRGEDKTMAGT